MATNNSTQQDPHLRFDTSNLWSVKSKTGESLSLSAYGGSLNFTVFPPSGNEGGAKVRTTLSLQMALYLRSLLQELKESDASSEDVRIPFVKNEYDSNTKTYKPGLTFVFVKDSRGMYSIEISDRNITPPIVFNLRCFAAFSRGTEVLSDQARSKLDLEALIERLKSVSLLTTASKFNAPKFNGNRNGGNNNYRNSNGGNNNYRRNSGGDNDRSDDDYEAF